MAIYYLETSALVKLYVREPGTLQMLRLAGALGRDRFAALTLTQIEMRSAIRRRERAGDIDSKRATMVLHRLQLRLEREFIQQLVTDMVLWRAAQLVDRYFLRGYDAIQLAGCLILKVTLPGEPVTFVSADKELLEAAESERIPVFEPSGP